MPGRPGVGMRRSPPAVTEHCDPVSGVYRPPTCGVGLVNSAAHRWAGKSSRVALTLEASASREHDHGSLFAGYRELRHDVRFRHADGRKVATTAIAHQPSEGIPRLDVDARTAKVLGGHNVVSALTVGRDAGYASTDGLPPASPRNTILTTVAITCYAWHSSRPDAFVSPHTPLCL